MNPGKWIKDSFLFGMITSFVSLIVFYFFISTIRTFIVNHYDNQYMMPSPTVQLLTMLVNIIFFRLLMVNFKKENTAKGFLLVTVLLTLAYLFIFFRVIRY